MKSFFNHLLSRIMVFLFFSMFFPLNTAQSDIFPAIGTWIAKSTFIDLADVETKKRDTSRQVYLPAGTRFLAYDKIDRIPGPKRRLILTETGLWGYIVDSDAYYWIPDKMDIFKSQFNQKAIIPRDCQIGCILDNISNVTAYLPLTRSEIYDIIKSSDDQITIQLTKEKLGKLWGIFPQEIDIPRDKAVILDTKDLNISFKDIPYFIKLPLSYNKPCEETVTKVGPPKTKILFIGASPGIDPKTDKPLGMVKFDREFRDIKEEISEYQALEIEFCPAARPRDVLRALERQRPQIVHFSGHADGEGILLEDDSGQARPVTAEALIAVFTAFNYRDNIQIVVLNACQTQPLAAAIAEVINCAIGMQDIISQNLSKTYSKYFYKHIASGCSVQEAHDRAIAYTKVEGVPGDNIPKLNQHAGFDCQSLRPVISGLQINDTEERVSITQIGAELKSNVTRYYYRISNAGNDIYKITEGFDCNTKINNYYSYANYKNIKYETKEQYGKTIIENPEDYFNIIDSPSIKDFGEYEKIFLISQRIKCRPPRR
jgi:hypothetical protein